MKHFSKLSLLLLFICCFYVQASAQQGNEDSKSTFNKFEAFSPLFMSGQTNAFHSANGMPGPEYWQNHADYDIEAMLDTTNHSVNGQMTITYTNNSPYDIKFLWLQLDQNTFRKDSRGSSVFPADDRNGVHTFTLSLIHISEPTRRTP